MGGQPVRLCLTVDQSDGSTHDVTAELRDAAVTLGDLVAALGFQHTTSPPVLDGRPLDERALGTPAVEAVSNGARLGAPGTARTPGGRVASVEPVVEVAVVAGLEAGASMQVPVGRYRIAAGSDGAPSRSGWYLAVDRPDLAAAQSAPWHEVGATFEAVDGPGVTVALGRPADPQPRNVGYVHRPPRPVSPDGGDPVHLEPAPKPVVEPAPLSWATLLGPIPVAIIMAVFFRPLFAVFAAIGPVVALGRWYEGRRRHRRDLRRRTAEVERLRSELAQRVAQRAGDEARARWHRQPHVAELRKRAGVCSARLWERRPASPGHLCFTVGYGPAMFTVPTEGAKHDPEVHDVARLDAHLRTVPHLVDLASGPGVGFHGDRRSALAMARSAILQLATLHGPADLAIGLVAPNTSRVDWDWIKWLPHTVDELIGPNTDDAAQWGTASPHAPAAVFRPDRELGRVRLLIVDDPAADVAALQRAAATGDHDLRVLAVAPAVTQLPAICTTLVDAAPDRAVLSSPHLSAVVQAVRPTGITRRTAIEWARDLAPMLDPELLEFSTGSADGAVGLLPLLDLHDAEALAARWGGRSPDQAVRVPVGAGRHGSFEIDLAEDGPHALVAGTTGSGKSEFLRTLVLSLAAACPPDQMNFVLVDFKGGGAFDACADLPHVAGLITDLDEALVERAINSLRAELHRREALFRRLGVSDWSDAAELADEAVPRLVIVIDEFAALATDYAELLASIIDLAARGRSLGMHLVLATQRPSGVVDQKIRANTNLRIALRVQDAFDSQDVIGVPDAAHIDRKRPGHAIFSIGGDTPVRVQTAYTGQPDARRQRCVVRPFTLAGVDAPHADPGVEMSPAAGGPAASELESLSALIVEACEALGQIARPLWPDPLPERFDWIDLGARLLSPDGNGAGLALGLVDLPDQQTQRPWRWNPDEGALALYGASAATAGRLLVAIGASIASRSAADDVHLFVLDGDAGGCAALAGLPHTGAYVRGAEADRVERVVAHLEATLAARRVEAQPEAPRQVLLVDNIAGLLAGFDEMQAVQLVERLSSLARDGAPQRIHLAITARTPRDLSHRLAQQIPVRLVAELADPAGYLTLGIKGSTTMSLPSMRVFELSNHRQVQLVEPPDLGDLALAAAADPDRAPTSIRPFPAHLRSDQLPPATIGDQGTLRIPVGVDQAQVSSAALVLRPGEHALVVGPPGSGRSNLLDLIGRQVLAIASDASAAIDVVAIGSVDDSVVLADQPHRRVTSVDELDELVASERAAVVLVDDADRLDDAMSQWLTDFGTQNQRHVRLVVAATPDHTRALRSNTSGLRAGATGVLLGGTPTDGDVFRIKRPTLHGLGQIPGRGHLVLRGRPIGVQFAACVRNEQLERRSV